VRKFLFTFSLWLAAISLTATAETLSLTDGGSVTGDIIKFDDNGIMVKTPEETYTNVAWGRFSQATLKQLGGNPKIKNFVEPFFEPDAAQRSQKAEIQVNAVTRLERPEPSLFGGLFKSSLGLFLLFVVYIANLLAAYEISIVKARTAAQVMGVSAILPIIGPVIFLVMKMNTGPSAAEKEAEAIAAEVMAAQHTPGKIEIGDASWKQADTAQPAQPKKAEPQIFARGKFTFNKRFVETKFADFTGAATGAQAKAFSMSLKTSKEEFTVERISSVAIAEIVLEVTQRGPVTVQLTDIQEIKLTPKAA
jgi:hypothetical protein